MAFGQQEINELLPKTAPMPYFETWRHAADDEDDVPKRSRPRPHDLSRDGPASPRSASEKRFTLPSVNRFLPIRYTWTSEAAKTAAVDDGPLPDRGQILFA